MFLKSEREPCIQVNQYVLREKWVIIIDYRRNTEACGV